MSAGCIVALVLGVFIAVIGGIALLASLLVAGSQMLLAKAGTLQSKVMMQSIKMAVKAYQTEYNRLPLSDLGVTDETQFMESGREIVNVLTATDSTRNPRGIVFYETPSRSGKGGGVIAADGSFEVRDQFGNRFRLHFDWNGDRVIPDPEHPGATISEPVIIYSAGPDLDYHTWKDNITSWKP